MPPKAMRKRNGRNKRVAVSPLGAPVRPPSDPPSFIPKPWFYTTVKVSVDAGGGDVNVALIVKSLLDQLSITCELADALQISFLKAWAYTESYNNLAAAEVSPPELVVGFSTILLQDGSVTAPTTGSRPVSDVGTDAKPAKVGYKWGILGQTPQIGSSEKVVFSIISVESVDVYVFLKWTTAGYLTLQNKLATLRHHEDSKPQTD